MGIVYYPSSSNMVASNIVPLTQSTIMSVLENKANGNVCRGPSTKFHSSHVAPISVSHYIQRIMHFGRCSVDDLLLASYYLDQMLKKNPAILYASKYINDRYFNNKAFAKIGGVSLGEMNSLEMEFLNCISYKLYVSDHDYETYKSNFLCSSYQPHYQYNYFQNESFYIQPSFQSSGQPGPSYKHHQRHYAPKPQYYHHHSDYNRPFYYRDMITS